MKERKLDGCYFRVQRDGMWTSRCFTDMTEEERREAIENRSPEWLKSMVILMSNTLREMADGLDIVFGER